MNEEKIKHISIELKVINLDLERIKTHLEDCNRNIKKILFESEIAERALDLKEMVEYNRFLLQKHKEKIAEKQEKEQRLKNYIQEENESESQLIRSEKRLEIFLLTLDKNISFNCDHPFYSDPSFIKDMIKEFVKMEDYESCVILKERLSQLDSLSLEGDKK